ncbi:MAG: glycoside hydrolase family 25 [Tissierellia bacterium]|jgi:GH25 family lysozyme M1 (1,4-beta-N-acetylmuramidase)|nr:glycoside hydrolase family 25 [Tissierellia bacterium]
MIIDISHHQNPQNMDYDKLSKQIDFVIIRTQYGSNLIDRHYQTHHREFEKRGVPRASYAWVRGVSIDDMKVEAIDYYKRTRDFEPSFYFLDIEERSMDDMRRGVSAYVDKLRELGAKRIGIYIAHHLYENFNLDFDKVDAIWIPHYGKNDGRLNSKPKFPCDIHQYTSVGRLNGYSGNLDFNRIISDKPLSYFTGLLGEDDISHIPSEWSKEAWEWAVAANLLDGTRPKDSISREELALVLRRFNYHINNNRK